MVRIGPAIALIAQLALLAALAGTVGLGALGWLVGVTYGLVTNTLLAAGLHRSGAGVLGPANAVTLSRSTLIGGVAALIADSFVRSASVTTIVGIVTIALVLDAVDGKVARRTSTVTPLGARFDMEVDSFLIVALSCYVADSIGPWVLAIGLARYAFVAAGWLRPWLRKPTPPRYWCKVVAVIEGIVLTIAVADFLPRPVIVVAVAVALVLLAESFGRQVWWLCQDHRSRARQGVGLPVGTSGAR